MSKEDIWVARHNTDIRVTSMMIVDLDPHIITGKIWATSKSVQETLRDFTYERMKTVGLDPGGVYYDKIPWHKFEVGGFTFEIQPHRCGTVINRVLNGIERLPGVIRFGMWLWHYYMPTELAADLVIKLDEIARSDVSLHAQLDWDDVCRKLKGS